MTDYCNHSWIMTDKIVYGDEIEERRVCTGCGGRMQLRRSLCMAAPQPNWFFEKKKLNPAAEPFFTGKEVEAIVKREIDRLQQAAIQ